MEAGSLLYEALQAKECAPAHLEIKLYPLSASVESLHEEIRREDARAIELEQEGESSEGDTFNWNDGRGPLMSRFDASLEAAVHYGDNVIDIWAAYRSIAELTSKFDCAATFMDSADGQIALIEAAEVIPTWLSPENSENRIFVKGGLLYIVGGGDLTKGLRIDVALRKVRDEEEQHVAPDVVLDLLDRKVREALATKNTHRAILSLPRDIAALIVRHRGVLNRAIESFSSQGLGGARAMRDKCMVLSRAPGNHSRFGPQTAVLVTFTRCQYAKLVFCCCGGDDGDNNNEDGTGYNFDASDAVAAAMEDWIKKNDNELASSGPESFEFPLPNPDDEDGLEWLNVPSPREFEDLMKDVVQGKRLEEVADVMNAFVKGKSDVDGVVGQEGRIEKGRAKECGEKTGDGKIDIDPEKFMRILQETLGGGGSGRGDHLDRYFSDSDESYQSDDDGSAERTELDDEVDAIKGRESEGLAHHHHRGNDHDVEVEVVTNLLESVLEQEGESGPAGNILKQLGIDLPDLTSGPSER